MRFDWYSATVPVHVSVLENTIKSHFGNTLVETRPVRPYEKALKDPKNGYRINFEGCNPHPFFVASGAESHDAAEFLRNHFPKHRVTRSDVAIDTCEIGSFQRLVDQITPIAKKARVQCRLFGDPDPNATEGRTFYFGSPTSDVRIRVYEKGLKEISEGNLLANPHWVRLELQVRPRKDRKLIAATIEPSALFGFAQWSQTVSQNVLGNIAEFIPDLSKRESDLDKAFRFMIEQYGNTLRGLAERDGWAVTLKRVRANAEDRSQPDGS